MENNIKSSGLLVLGNNQDGCLLTGDLKDVLNFTVVEFPFSSGDDCKYKLSTGMSSCASYFEKTVYIWGKFVNILKSDCSSKERYLKLEFEENVVKVKIGDCHILILISDGNVFALGEGSRGQTGIPKQSTNDNCYSPVEFLSSSTRIETQTKISKIFAGVRTSFLLDGKVYKLFRK